MMKRIVLSFSLIVFAIVASYSQSYKIPNTPAFSILDYEPSSVMRPTSFKELSGDVLNSFDENGNLMMNLGMEVTPYWLQSNPTLTREAYINPTMWQSVKQTFTLSAATVKDSITNSNNLGFGFRTQLIQGKVSTKYQEKYQLLQAYETAIGVVESVRIVVLPTGTLTSYDAVLAAISEMAKEADLDESLISDVMNKGKALQVNYGDTVNLEQFCFDLSKAIDTSINDLTKEVIALQKQRTGFSLEVASAAKFLTTSDSKNAFNKFGFWVNACNDVSETDAFTLTARLTSTTKDTLNVSSDVGLGYLKSNAKYTISVEGMLRWYRMEIPTFDTFNQPITAVEKEFTYRLAAQLSYNLTENISANVSLGKDFDSPTLSGTTFFSIFGLQYSLFDKLETIIK